MVNLAIFLFLTPLRKLLKVWEGTLNFSLIIFKMLIVSLCVYDFDFMKNAEEKAIVTLYQLA